MLLTDQTRYWETVKQCLTQLHEFSRVQAANKVTAFKRQLEKAQLGDVIYNDEPYDVACDIAGHECHADAYWERYQAIRDEFFPETTDRPEPQCSRRSKVQTKGSVSKIRQSTRKKYV